MKKYALREQHPKRSKKQERKRWESIEQLPAPSGKPFTRTVAAEQFPLSQRTSATSLKRSTLVPVTPASQAAGMVGTQHYTVYWFGDAAPHV